MSKRLSFEIGFIAVTNYYRMKRTPLFFLPFLLFSVAYAQVNIQWQTRYSSAGANVDRAEDMVMDASGNVYVTGIAKGASGNFDYVTIKYNASGSQVWLAEYNGPGNSLDEAHAVTVDASGNVYVTGWSYGNATTGYDYATVMYNSSGVQQWAARYNNTTNGTDEAFDIAVDNAGNVYVTGSSDGSGSNSAATTVKYNSAGVQQWAIRYDGAGAGVDAGYSIYVDGATGTSYVTGYTYTSAGADFDFITLKYNTAGAQQWAKLYDGIDGNYDEARSVTVDAAGNVYVTGYSQTAVLTNYDYATVKYNSAGTQQWARQYNGTGDDYDRSNQVKVDAAYNVYVTGKSVGVGSTAEDFLTIKYDAAGTQKWLARYNGPSNGYDEGKALSIDATGNVYVTGYSYTTGANNDYTTIKYDSTGVQQWLTKYNGTGNNSDQAVAMTVDAVGNVFVTGQSKGAGTTDDYETIKYCQLTADAGADVSICTGASTTLNASALGAVAFSWTPTTGLSDPSIANPIANPTTTTTYVVAITNTTGCVDLDTMVVTVLPLPAPSITPSGPTTFCVGGSVTLTAATATSYQWSTSPADTLQSITVSASGTYSVLVSNGVGCSSSASQTVTVVTLPAIDAGLNDSTCLSTNIQLGASGGISYVWHPGATLSDSTIFNPIAGPTLTTTYTVVGTASGGCSNVDSVTITVLGNPSVPTIARGTDTLYCLAAATTYQWYLNGSPIPGATSQNYIFTVNGTYYVEVSNAQGCTTVSTTITVSDVSVHDLSASESNLMVYPNPFNDQFTVEFNIDQTEQLKVNLLNIQGQVIYSDELRGFKGNYKKNIDLNSFANGIYQLQVITDGSVVTRKVVKH